MYGTGMNGPAFRVGNGVRLRRANEMASNAPLFADEKDIFQLRRVKKNILRSYTVSKIGRRVSTGIYSSLPRTYILKRLPYYLGRYLGDWLLPLFFLYHYIHPHS